MTIRKCPVVLLILDGFGVRAETADNAVLQAAMPVWQRLCRDYAFGTIEASEHYVGLPSGQFGNSEVGHLNIGAGRVLLQDISRIDAAIADQNLGDNAVLRQLWAQSQQHLHFIGLLSDGGVHSHIDHLFALLDAACAAGVASISVHAFLDGRDTPPRSAMAYLQRLQDYCAAHPQVVMSSIMGRFFAMDRDQRWERVSQAYQALKGHTEYHAADAMGALKAAYARGENDEFVKPVFLAGGLPLTANDTVMFTNFRADRARELTEALTLAAFDGFDRGDWQAPAAFVSMTSYGAQYEHPVVFAPQTVTHGFGETVAAAGLRQLRIAETEKYPHVTYFFSGGRETPYSQEERILIPSPKVTTYDSQPAMSAREVTDEIVRAIEGKRTDVIICNYANGDMVGHTGVMAAAVAAVEVLDECIGRVVDATLAAGGEVLISADHGNCEEMFDHKTGQVHTQHTTNPVPFLYVGEPAQIKSGGALKDIAPTLLAMLGLPKPEQMTGENLIEWIN